MKVTTIALMIGLIPGGVLAEPPDDVPTDPPVAHTNQGRTVEDTKPTRGAFDDEPKSDESRWRDQMLPPTFGSDPFHLPDHDPLRIPGELPGLEVSRPAGQITVTPAPATLTLLGLAGLGLCKRRRDQFRS